MLALLQEFSLAAPPVLRFVIGFLLILTFYSGALLFTYWISKDE